MNAAIWDHPLCKCEQLTRLFLLTYSFLHRSHVPAKVVFLVSNPSNASNKVAPVSRRNLLELDVSIHDLLKLPLGMISTSAEYFPKTPFL